MQRDEFRRLLVGYNIAPAPPPSGPSAQYCTALCCIAQHWAALHCTTLHRGFVACFRGFVTCIFHQTTLHCAALHWTALCYIILLCTVLCRLDSRRSFESGLRSFLRERSVGSFSRTAAAGDRVYVHAMLHCAAPDCAALHFVILHCTARQWLNRLIQRKYNLKSRYLTGSLVGVGRGVTGTDSRV